jgi:hypothetical protein
MKRDNGSIEIVILVFFLFLFGVGLWGDYDDAQKNKENIKLRASITKSMGIHKGIKMPKYYKGNELKCNTCHDEKKDW